MNEANPTIDRVDGRSERAWREQVAALERRNAKLRERMLLLRGRPTILLCRIMIVVGVLAAAAGAATGFAAIWAVDPDLSDNLAMTGMLTAVIGVALAWIGWACSEDGKNADGDF